MSKVLVLPDLQIPFEHKDALDFVKHVKKLYGPFDHVINLGDEVDFHAISNYDPDPDGFSAGHELEEALKHLKPWAIEFPKMLICTSNHTARPFRKAYAMGLPKAFIKDYHEFLNAPHGWQWRDYWKIDGVKYEHGEGVSGQSGAIKKAMSNRESTCIGHLHSDAGILFHSNGDNIIFGFNVGCLIDRHRYAFRYGKHDLKKPILGCGLVIDGIPFFIPMILDKNDRWIGK